MSSLKKADIEDITPSPSPNFIPSSAHPASSKKTGSVPCCEGLGRLGGPASRSGWMWRLGVRERTGLERRLLAFAWPTEVGWGVDAAVREGGRYRGMLGGWGWR